MLRIRVTTSGEKGGRPERRCMSRCAALLRACTPASVRLEIVNLTGSTEFSRSAASCGDRQPATTHGTAQGVRAGRGWSCRLLLPPGTDHHCSGKIEAYLQVVLHPNSARITLHGCDSTAERDRRELSSSVGAVLPGVAASRHVR